MTGAMQTVLTVMLARETARVACQPDVDCDHDWTVLSPVDFLLDYECSRCGGIRTEPLRPV